MVKEDPLNTLLLQLQYILTLNATSFASRTAEELKGGNIIDY